MNGKLYLVATPIGNLEDITLRALRILREVDLIAAEDTRHTLKLLNYYEISKPLYSYHRHNEEVKADFLLEKLKEGQNIAVVSDAGTPIICDPGEQIVREALKEEIEVIPIPGACAFVNALIASGLDTREFCFYGFLSVNKKLKKEKLEQIRKENKTVILYEAPHKLRNTLEEMKRILGNREIVVARELTKIHEEFRRGTISEILESYIEPKGEHIILIQGNATEDKEEDDDLPIESLYEQYQAQGISKKEIIKKIARQKGVNKNEIYQKFIKQ